MICSNNIVHQRDDWKEQTLAVVRLQGRSAQWECAFSPPPRTLWRCLQKTFLSLSFSHPWPPTEQPGFAASSTLILASVQDQALIFPSLRSLFDAGRCLGG